LNSSIYMKQRYRTFKRGNNILVFCSNCKSQFTVTVDTVFEDKIIF
jgi:hypothetical protein